MSYMSKKAHKRQTTIVTLSDQNQQEIRMINEQKEQMLEEYEEKKRGDYDLVSISSDFAHWTAKTINLGEFKCEATASGTESRFLPIVNLCA